MENVRAENCFYCGKSFATWRKTINFATTFKPDNRPTMKKWFIILGTVIIVLSTACVGGNGESASTHATDSISGDSTLATSDDAFAKNDADELTFTGIVTDGSKNAIFLQQLDGDKVEEFEFPDLPQDKRCEWNVGDTITVKYISVAAYDEPFDSVTAISRAKL